MHSLHTINTFPFFVRMRPKLRQNFVSIELRPSQKSRMVN